MAERALIVGIEGFAGSALKTELQENGYEVFGVDIVSSGDDVIIGDMTDPRVCSQIMGKIKPDYIFNLAGQASPGVSWRDPALTMRINVDLSVNIAMAVKELCPKTRMLFIGSANQYDIAASEDKTISESCPLSGDSPYSVSKNTQEELLLLLAKRYDLDMVFTRSFNHTGPGQKTGFVVTDYAKRIADLEKGLIDTFTYGDLDSRKDFSDVRDVVRAYRLLAERGTSGQIYNVGSGESFYLRDMIAHMVEKSPAAMKATTLPPDNGDRDLPEWKADISKLVKDTGFVPQCDIYHTIEQVLEAART